MEKCKIEAFALKIVNDCMKENMVDLDHDKKDMLIMIGTACITMGYQLAHTEMLDSLSRSMMEIRGDNDVKVKP